MIYKYIAPLSILFFGLTFSALAQDADTFLKGSVQEQGYMPKQPAPGLKRQDLNKGGDAFAGEIQSSGNNPINQEFDPPAGAFEIPTTSPPMPPAQDKNFNLKANMENADFGGEPMSGMPDQSGTMMPEQSAQASSPQLKSQDPDSSPELQLAWDQWHKRVAEAIYIRFNNMAQFAFKYSKPLACYITYTVTRDGRVTNVQMPRKSPNIAFNTMVFLVVNSISGQKDLLAFPDGSRRTTVDKSGMFTQNYGVQGFKYVTGDRETVRQQQSH